MKKIIFLVLCCWVAMCCLTACVNSIEEVEEAYHPGTVPITFSGKVSKLSQTRVTDKALEEGDEVGLLAVISGNSISGNRYIDNLLLKTSTGSALTPNELVYYPEGEGAKLDFIAYHPFVKQGIPGGSSRMSVRVEKDQSDDKKRNLSDFLIAKKNKVGASKESVQLSFKHKMAKVKVELILNDEKTAEDILASNPVIKACGFMTQAIYDVASDEFSELSNPEIITLSGSWKKSGSKLIGKEMIVIPQTLSSETQYLALEVRGKLYTCKLSASSLGSNSQRVISIVFTEAEDSSLAGFVGEVQDWNEGAVAEEQAESSYLLGAIQTELLSCSQSNIYHIFSNGQLLAELCKEYLRLPDAGIDAQAWVIYPAKGGVVELAEGTVLELLGVSESVHGGKIQWNTENHSVRYQAGTSHPIKSFYINDQGEIVFEKPEKTLTVHVKTYMLRDIRGDEVNRYGLVKIGSQYWMREEIKASKYVDGTPIKLQQTMSQDACYLRSESGHFFYNREALLTGKMAPKGWIIPQDKDWKVLADYVGEASALKSGNWTPLSGVSTEVAPVTNLAMFYAEPVGIWMDLYQGKGSLQLFWSMEDETAQVASKAFGLVANYSDIQWVNNINSKTSLSKGLSLRFIRP